MLQPLGHRLGTGVAAHPAVDAVLDQFRQRTTVTTDGTPASLASSVTSRSHSRSCRLGGQQCTAARHGIS